MKFNTTYSLAALALVAATSVHAQASPSPVSSPNVTVPYKPLSWIKCTAEDGQCVLPRPAVVGYGAAGKFRYRLMVGTVSCSNAVFGDPIVGVAKFCYYGSDIAAAPVQIHPPVVVVPPVIVPPVIVPPVVVPPVVVPPVIVPPVIAPGVTPPVVVAPPVTTVSGSVGINVGGSVYYASERTYANLAYASGGWMGGTMNANGYPTSDSRIFLNIPQPVWAGVETLVTCTWKGAGKMFVDGDRRAETYADHTFSVFWKGSPGNTLPGMFLNYSGADATDPLHDLVCMEPGLKTVGQFDARIVDDLKPFGVLRFLDMGAANSNPPSVTWAARTTLDRLGQDGVDGTALENMIDLANASGSDAWFNVPWNVDADYVQRMGQLIHDRLNTNHKAYVELSNEVWNFQFGQTNQALNEGLAEGLSTDHYSNQLLRLAEKTIWMNKILTPIFADNSTRLVRVIASQHANPWAGQQVMGFKDVANWVDAFATAPYFGHSFFDGANAGVTDMPTLFASLETMRVQTLAQAKGNKDTADKYGKRYIAYEGGQHILATDKTRDGPIIALMERSPLMYDIYTRYLSDITKVVDQIEIYSMTGSISQYGSWGIREYAGQPLSDTPKRRAVLEYIQAKSVK